jgi:hypothetical protein
MAWRIPVRFVHVSEAEVVIVLFMSENVVPFFG